MATPPSYGLWAGSGDDRIFTHATLFALLAFLGERGNGATALQPAEDLHPDPLFLDIQMPDGTYQTPLRRSRSAKQGRTQCVPGRFIRVH